MGDRSNQGDHGDVLTNRRRRLVLSQLQSHESMTLRDLAEQIAVTDQQVELESICQEAIKEVEIALHHVHVPKLADAGYVEYDRRRGLASLTDSGRELRIETECQNWVESSERVTVELCLETIDELHERIRHDERLDSRMTYDEVVSTILAASDENATQSIEDEEEAR